MAAADFPNAERARAAELPQALQAPPAHLSEAASEFFLNVVERGVYDAPARALLIRFCEVADQLAKCRGELEKFPEFTFTDKHGQPRIHPLVKHELALTNEYGKLFRLLGWDQAPPDAQLLLPGFRR